MVVRSGLALVFALFSLLAPAQAQDYPNRPITMVVAAAAGGPIDVFGRIFAEKLSDKLGQRVVIENVGGGGGTVGGQKVARATPDGYTVLLGTVATHTNPTLLVDKPPYDPVADFTPVALVSEIPLVLITRKDFPANTLKEFVAYAKANQSKMNYGSAGVGSAAHLGCVMLDNAMGTHIQHVPYRGTSLAMQDLVSGRLDFLCEIAVTAVQNINAGTVKGIAVLSPNRSPVLPNIPTAAEEGLPSVQAYTWTALFLPKDTPAPIAAKLQKAAAETMDTPGLKEEMEKLAATFVAPERRSSAYLGQFVKDELTKWGNAMRASGVIPK
ncbi:Bug family tripartite tricarboxylate transporter substrate binding protein [Pseudolabrys taiwanensis]|nr:tripartite tricarboxylate transporter substrate-binding protein [Pseudolabrys taiwanensis]